MQKPKLKKPKQTQQGAHVPLFAAVADVHLGNHREAGGALVGDINDRARLALATMDRAYDIAVDRRTRWLVAGGDTFDRSKPEPRLIGMLGRTIERCLQQDPPLGTILLPGNHEMSEATCREGATSLDPLTLTAAVPYVTTRYPIAPGHGLLALPFTAEEPMGDFIAKQLDAHPAPPDSEDWVAVHVGVFDDSTPAFLRGDDAIRASELHDALERNGYVGAVVGNFHNHQVWETEKSTIVQVGTLCPASWSDEGEFPLRGGMALIYPGRRLEMVEITGPRFLQGGGRERIDRQLEGCRVFYRPEKNEPPDESLAGEGVTLVERPPPPPKGVALAVQTTMASTDNVREAVQLFCEQLELDEADDSDLRDRVYRRALKHLGKDA